MRRQGVAMETSPSCCDTGHLLICFDHYLLMSAVGGRLEFLAGIFWHGSPNYLSQRKSSFAQMVRAMPLDPVRTYRILRWGEITNKKIKVVLIYTCQKII